MNQKNLQNLLKFIGTYPQYFSKDVTHEGLIHNVWGIAQLMQRHWSYEALITNPIYYDDMVKTYYYMKRNRKTKKDEQARLGNISHVQIQARSYLQIREKEDILKLIELNLI
jgi:hypothetical protein